MRVLVVGAGALGGGAIAPLLIRAGHEVVFLDFNPNVYYLVNSQACDVVLHGKSIETFSYNAVCYQGIAAVPKVDAVFTCARPIAPASLWAKLEALNVPVVMLENDVKIPDMARGKLLLGVADILSHVERVYISEDASTGRGCIYVDAAVRRVLGDVNGLKYLDSDKLRSLWPARFVTHNTGHCVLAYLGSSRRHKLMCDAARDVVAYMPAQESMYEAGTALDNNYDFRKWLGIPDHYDAAQLHKYWVHYYDTEIGRYRGFVPDTVARVARDPLRKLAYRERLVGPARAYYESTGKLPFALIMGIREAIKYSGKDWSYVMDQVCRLEQGHLRRAIEEEFYREPVLRADYSFARVAASTPVS